MAKKIPSKEFKIALTGLNDVLKKADKKPIKFVAVEKEVVVENFIKTIVSFIDADKIVELPDNVIDFYNTYIVDDEDGDDGGGEAGEETPAPAKKKGKKEKKPKKEKKEKPPKEPKAPGICVLAIKAYMEDDAKSIDEIVAVVQPGFPDRNIRKTISHVFGVLRHIRPYPKK